MHTWKKTQNVSCIYCNNELNDSKHLLLDCISLGNTWQLILLGLEDHQSINVIVSLVCFLIHKKYLVDKKNDNKTIMPIEPLKGELRYRIKNI